MKWAQLAKLGRALPGVAEGIWFRTPALEVAGKSFCRLKEDGESVVFLLESIDEQEALIGAMPAIYYITDHYRGWATVLARLNVLSDAEARLRLERSWRTKAPKPLVKQRSAAMTVTIYHNPKCTKSRETLALLEQRGLKPTVIEYLKTPPSAAQLDTILKQLELEPRALMRTKEAAFEEAGLADPKLTRKQLIAAMVANPILIERPIVVSGKRAAIGRPPERVLEIL